MSARDDYPGDDTQSEWFAMLGEIDRLRTEIETVAGEKAAAWHTIDLLRGDLMWMTSRLDAAGIPFSHVLSSAGREAVT